MWAWPSVSRYPQCPVLYESVCPWLPAHPLHWKHWRWSHTSIQQGIWMWASTQAIFVATKGPVQLRVKANTRQTVKIRQFRSQMMRRQRHLGGFGSYITWSFHWACNLKVNHNRLPRVLSACFYMFVMWLDVIQHPKDSTNAQLNPLCSVQTARGLGELKSVGTGSGSNDGAALL